MTSTAILDLSAARPWAGWLVMHNVVFSIVLEILVINNFASNENKEKKQIKTGF